MKRTRLLIWLFSVFAWAVSLSCNVNDYCLNCATGDGGDGDANGDGNTGDGNGDGNNGDGGPCVNTGLEICDGKDNDCDGNTDEGTLPEVGDACGTGMGACAGGVKQCVNGAIKCSKNPAPEQCNNIDDDCDGTIDNGDPGGGAKCGTDNGECTTGTLHCNPSSHVVTCGVNCGTINAINCPVGIHCLAATNDCPPAMIDPVNFGVAESCDGKDNDCDNKFDEQIGVLGSCSGGPVNFDPALHPDTTCHPGELVCDGAGGTKCQQIAGQSPPAGPTVEICNDLDDDCDGVPDNGFSTASDPTNCGNCGNVCNLPHAFEGCAVGQCTVAGCEPDFHNNNGQAADGCEFGPCTIQSSVEICNGIDDDCNPATGNNPPAPCGNCAETGLTAPVGFTCPQVGACAGTLNSCHGTGGFQCDFGANVSHDANNNIVPENRCDGIDNDCDGATDEGQFGTPNDNIPNKGTPCTEDGTLGTVNKHGICQGHGHVDCNPNNLTGPAVCIIDFPGSGPNAVELCNGKDDDCDGNIDEGANTGNLVGQEWVTIPGTTRQIMKYEASQPDATDVSGGTRTNFACSREGVLPWVNVTYPQALAACQSIGATLCTEAEWQNECMPRVTYPVAGPASAFVDDFTFIEAEDFFANTTIGGATHAWTAISPVATNGTTLMEVPENGLFVASAANALAQSSRLDYQLNLNATTNYFVWLRMRPPEASPVRGFTAATQVLNPTSPASTAVGDLVIVTTWTFTTTSGVPTHTLQTGFTQITTEDHDDGNSDGRLSVAFKVATAAGAVTYQAYTASTGTSFTGLMVLKAGTFDTTAISSATSDTNVNGGSGAFGAGSPNPPAIGPVTNPSFVLALGAWHFGGGSGSITTAPDAALVDDWQTTGNRPTEFAAAHTFVAANGSVNPGFFTEIGNTTGAVAATIAIGLKSRSVYVGLTQGTTAGNATAIVGASESQWVVSPLFTTTTAGTYTFSIYTRDDGVDVDTIAIARQNTNSPTFDNAWAYQTNPRTPQDQTCNADPVDTDAGTTGDQDGAIPTGTLPACFANHGGQDAFDMSGNVKEWTLARVPNQNPLRGGASNNEVIGTTCQLNFSLADDTFFFPNVGFRCCRGP